MRDKLIQAVLRSDMLKGSHPRLIAVAGATFLVAFLVIGYVGASLAQRAADPEAEAAYDEQLDEDLLQRLLAEARSGQGDTHMPFVLHRLVKALSEQDLIGFLDLVDPDYFETQFGALMGDGRSPGEAMNQFSCEFFALCDVSKTYKFVDVVSAQLVGVAREGEFVSVDLEMRMWDGVTVSARVFYDPRTFRLSSAYA